MLAFWAVLAAPRVCADAPQLGVQVLEAGLRSRASNGGLRELGDVLQAVRQLRG